MAIYQIKTLLNRTPSHRAGTRWENERRPYEGRPDRILGRRGRRHLAHGVWRPAAALVFLKPSLFPLAFFGLRSRGWWVVAGIFAVVSLVLLPQTLDWLAVIRNGQGGLRSGLTYSFPDLPLLAVPLLAWAGGEGSESAGRHVRARLAI